MKYIEIGGKIIYVSEEVYKAYRSSKRREKYLEESDEAHGVISIESLFLHDVPAPRNAEQEYERNERSRALWAALDKLTDDEFDLIDRIFFEGESLADIAREKNMDYKKLWNYREKILKKLRDSLGKLD